MQVLDAGSELHNPNVCAICEEKPEGPVIDTERVTPFNPVYPLNGRKYICNRCGDEIARLFGYQSGESITQALKDSLRMKEEIKAVRARVIDVSNELYEFITSESVDQIKPVEPKISAPKAKDVPVVAEPVVDVKPEEVKPEETETRSYEEVFGAPEVKPAPKDRRSTKSTVESKSETVK